VKKEKQLTGRKLCSFFAKPQKQICPPYFSSNTKRLVTKNLEQLKIFGGKKIPGYFNV
jgi:hypothetical protein